MVAVTGAHRRTRCPRWFASSLRPPLYSHHQPVYLAQVGGLEALRECMKRWQGVSIPPAREPDPVLTPQSLQARRSEWVTNASESITAQFLLWKFKTICARRSHSSRNKIRPQQILVIMMITSGKAFGLTGRARVHSPAGDGRVGNDCVTRA